MSEKDAAANVVFRELQAKARNEHRGNTQPLLVVYAIESFLRRLAISDYAGRMVLKGGMLMAANEIRRMTKDADLSTHGVGNGEDDLREVVSGICVLEPDPDDGIAIDPASIRTERMREDAEYQGVRVGLVAGLGRAKIPFALDLSFGDPGTWIEIELTSVVDRPAVRLAAYPLVLNLAEKIVTAMQRRETSTRDRDFADLWVTSRLHALSARDLRASVGSVAEHRGQPLIPLSAALRNIPDRQGPYAAMVDRMAYLAPPPGSWAELIADVIAFVDPLLADEGGALLEWNTDALRWM
ncbi:nucleotidyl transferase AbiEii/AbiGii toxin family protein [Conexibacter woesei]|uniref:nucleotidyl transferase AbiEii/AbiGii toxin family protein n=1 Tax=Conexibacter woesei TaxID=191495 RepID=UPI000402A824|nr:nucleotidyl transferase AbiEii/AbiGii toxin family protein [Conexibacter woesei]